MRSDQKQVFGGLSVDHIRFFVADVDATAADLSGRYGFGVRAVAGRPDAGEEYSVALGSNGITLVLTTARIDDHRGSVYLAQHGDGVADIALRSTDAVADFAVAVERGATPVAHPSEHEGVITATIAGFGDVLHTFVQRLHNVDEQHLPGFGPVASDAADVPKSWLRAVDHIAVCLPAGELEPTVEFYTNALDFRTIFAERIVVRSQAMDSKVVQSRSGAVTLTLLEPDTSRDSGQIDEFLKNHGGAGVQHVAFSVENIVRSVGLMRSRGVEFLTTPESYYRQLPDRLELTRYPIERLGELNILADEDHDGQLFQIFAKSVHPRGTFFFEVIERFGARTFGSGNIRALYEAVRAVAE